MATSCLKRSSRLKELQPPQLRLNELICPICRTILREPVTLPCSHNLCLRCLRGTVQHNSLTCPLCRQRVGSWLRSATKTESLVNDKLWQHIRDRYPQELELAATSSSQNVDFDDGFIPKTILSAAGEIRKEYEAQLKIAEKEMRRQQEKEKLASETLIKKLQSEEDQKKLVQLAQDQLLAKTLAKEKTMEKTSNRYQRSNRSSTLVNLAVSKSNSEESKSTKTSVRSKNTTNSRKQNVALISKIRSVKCASNSKTNSINNQEETLNTFISHKPVPIHNAVTRVVTHQNRDELNCSTSKIYGLQSKEELHVPSDVISSKKKKLGVEVCVTNVEGEERIGSAESAGSHDSINQEIHHFKPIKALPRTPLRVTKEGKQCDPKLIRVLPIHKKGSNAVPKPPSQTHLKKILGCSWSAFKRISKQQVLQKDFTSVQPQETKTEKKSLLSHDVIDSNDNYTKNVNKAINGTKVSKKLNLDAQIEIKPGKRVNKVKNGLVLSKYKSQKETNSQKVIEVVDLADDDPPENLTNENITQKECTPDPLAFTPKNLDDRPLSPMFDMVIENIAERIKRRKATRTTSNSENVQSAINQVSQPTTKTKPKKSAPKKVRNSKQTKTTSANTAKTAKTSITAVTNKAKTKTKAVITTAITSHIKKLAARSSKRPRYTEDSESEEEEEEEEEEAVPELRQIESNVEQKRPETSENVELDRPDSSPPPPKKVKKTVRAPRKSKPRKIVQKAKSPILKEEELVKEQERLDMLAAQEQKDKELARMLQEQFDAMERIAGRTRRGAANRPPSPILGQLLSQERRPQKRALVQ